jgi:formyltetrahydrofolate deformylase
MKNHAILLISCPDRRGIVATVSNFLYRHGANIVDADEHLDDEIGMFFMRVEWDLIDFDLKVDSFNSQFGLLARGFNMNWRLTFTNHRPKIAIFVSREDHCLSDLLYRQQRKELFCDISVVFSNHATSEKLVAFYKVPFYTIATPDKKAVEKETLQLLKKFKIDLIVLARYMRILSPDFVSHYVNRIINIHHSFLPAFKGARPYHQAHMRGVKIIGATSHYVTEKLDEGPIIEQDVIRISHKDNVGDIMRKGGDLERVVLSRAVRWHIENRIVVYKNKTVLFD